MLEALEMCCWRKMQKICWTEGKTNEEFLMTMKEKRTLLDILKKKGW